MEKISFEFLLPHEQILLGFACSYGTAIDPLQNEEDCIIISLGILIFSMNIIIRK